jgi:tryptophan-rich sensory protein
LGFTGLGWLAPLMIPPLAGDTFSPFRGCCLRTLNAIMNYAIQWLRSLLFSIVMYILMAVAGIVFLPYAIHRGAATYLWYSRCDLAGRLDDRP